MPTPLDPDRPVRWGIVATGAISAIFVGDLRRTPGCEVVAVGSRTPASAEAFAAEHGIPRAHPSYEGLVDDDDVDVVYVGASHSAHFSVTRALLEAGRPVLCEKPLTVDATQAAELVALSRSWQVFLMEAMWMRCRPGFATLAATLASGVIGEIHSVRAEFGFHSTPGDKWRLFDPAQAGGALLDVGVYPVTLAQALFGEPESVRALAHIEGAVDRTVVVTMNWANGMVGLLGGSIEASTDCSATIAGSAGKITIPAPFHHIESFTISPIDGPERTVDCPWQGFGYVHEAAEVVRCLRAGLTESPLVPLDDTVAVMRTLDECRRQIGLEYPEAAYR